MEEPEKENIKLPFLQGCRIQLFNQNLCKHYGFYTLGLCPVGISFFFFSNLFNRSLLGSCLYCTLNHTVGISKLILRELPKQVLLRQKRAPRGLT